MKPSGKPLKVALLGCGVVGTEVVRILTERADDLALLMTLEMGKPVAESKSR